MAPGRGGNPGPSWHGPLASSSSSAAAAAPPSAMHINNLAARVCTSRFCFHRQVNKGVPSCHQGAKKHCRKAVDELPEHECVAFSGFRRQFFGYVTGCTVGASYD